MCRTKLYTYIEVRVSERGLDIGYAGERVATRQWTCARPMDAASVDSRRLQLCREYVHLRHIVMFLPLKTNASAKLVVNIAGDIAGGQADFFRSTTFEFPASRFEARPSSRRVLAQMREELGLPASRTGVSQGAQRIASLLLLEVTGAPTPLAGRMQGLLLPLVVDMPSLKLELAKGIDAGRDLEGANMAHKDDATEGDSSLFDEELANYGALGMDFADQIGGEGQGDGEE